ncbi:MAG: two-component system, chemotaxis family, sensor kinase CheA [Phycisphaerales bacterium]|nr:two-component system, chemotaxis family, sensor kinase CheA [Phycisphaerales bacterium]
MQTLAKLLVIEDEADARAALMRALIRAGHEVVGAVDGNDALSLFLHDPADAVVLDARMPIMDGAAFLQVLRSYVRWRNVPVILVTAVPDGPELDRVTRHGIQRVFKKTSYQLTDLLKCVNEVVGRDDC